MSKMIFIFIIFFGELGWSSLGLNPFGGDFKPQDGSLIQVTNMPRTRSQDTFGLCVSFVTSTLIDEANCVVNHTPDCANVPDSEKASSLDMARYSQRVNDQDPSDRESYHGLEQGGDMAFSLYNAGFLTESVVKESCAPFDQVVSRVADDNQARQTELAMWKKFSDSYGEFQRRQKSCS